MKDTEQLIARILESYKSAVFAKDVDAFMQLYDPNVRVFDAWGVWSYEGSAAWRVAVQAWLTSLQSEKVRVTFDDKKISGGNDLAFVSAIVTYAGVSAEGEHLREMQNRITWVLRMSGHLLRIVHEHTSAPMDFNDTKAILQRTRAE